MKQSDDAVCWVLACAWWTANAEASDINRNGFIHNITDVLARHHNSWVRAAYARFVLRVLPDKCGSVWLSLEVEEQQRPGR